jgi:RNA polymerase primary sigma factor
MSEICKRYIKDIGNSGGAELLTPEEEKILSKKIKKGCKESLETLINRNLRLVIKTSHRYVGCGVDSMDLINEGNLGLIIAAKRYKPTKGTKFSTYAGYWIRQKMLRYINNHGRTIRIPCHAYATFCDLKKEYERLNEMGQELPSISVLAKKFNSTERKIKSLLPYVNIPVSIDGCISDEGDDTFEQHIPSIESDANSQLIDKEKIEVINKALSLLTKRERYILEHRFGLHGDKKETLESIGKKYKVTRERIRQIERDSLLKLKNILEKNNIEL